MKKIGLLLVAACVIGLGACGSSNNGSTVTGVATGCSPSPIQSSQMIQCDTIVYGTGSFLSTVTWKSDIGTINTAGVFTAPVVLFPTLATITATSTQNTSQSGIATVVVKPVNLQPVTVDAGPQPQTFTAVNEAFTAVTVCVPNTTNCQTIDHVLVDTGSVGLRLLSSVLTIPLPQQNDLNGNPLDECQVFLDGFTWGSVSLANVSITGEQAFSAPIQVILPDSSSPPVPSNCSSQTTGPNEGNSVAALGANGILGLGYFQHDCGAACVAGTGSAPAAYYDCPASGCNTTYVTLAQQVPNLVAMFPSDNNGVLLYLPTVPVGGSGPSVSGSLIFGIGTQSNNNLQSATIYNVPDSGSNAGDITTTFNGVPYPNSFIDSGSNGIFFLDSATTGIPTCADNSSFYCPTTSPDRLTAINQGTNGIPGVVNFSIEDADRLFSTGNVAFSTLGGPLPGVFDWGLSFFYGRVVFTAIENTSTPAGPGPYVAY